MTTTTTLSCSNCLSVNTSGNLVSSILLQNENELVGGTTTISIASGLSSLFSYWVGVPADDKTTDPPVLQFCPECAHIFRELHKISVQFLKLSGTESQVAKRLAELRQIHGITSSSHPHIFKGQVKKEVTQGQGRDLGNQQIDPNVQIKKDPEDDLDLAVLIKEEEEDLVQQYPDDPLHFDDDSVNERRAYGEIRLKTEDDAGDSEADDFAIDPLKLSGDESSNYSASSGDQDNNDSEPDNAEPDTAPATPNPLQCSVCFKTFASQETRDRHFRHQHDESFTPLPCPADNCDLTFKRGEHLRTHIVNHHPDVPCPPVKGRLAYKSKGAASSSKVPCRVATCHKKYSSSNNMYHHMRTAHPEVPLKMQRNAKGSQEAKDANIKSELNRVKVKKACPICRKLYNSNILNTHIM
ncbi:zinc finger protein 521 [Folsomia candida]|uniref:zinc finger protein 521 n=1 Tax=Folsomia candida TaxID=158441 RepID=UPI000B8FCD0C|nr:zinc finger protein 521 [Folsomia candida]